MRFILVATHPTAAYCVFLSKSGFTAYRAENAAILPSLDEARKELEYHRTYTPRYSWRIEKLPARLSVGKAILRAVPVV